MSELASHNMRKTKNRELFWFGFVSEQRNQNWCLIATHNGVNLFLQLWLMLTYLFIVGAIYPWSLWLGTTELNWKVLQKSVLVPVSLYILYMWYCCFHNIVPYAQTNIHISFSFLRLLQKKIKTERVKCSSVSMERDREIWRHRKTVSLLILFLPSL